jgi:hypothetical protein
MKLLSECGNILFDSIFIMTEGTIKILIEDFNFYYDGRNDKKSNRRFQFLSFLPL